MWPVTLILLPIQLWLADFVQRSITGIRHWRNLLIKVSAHLIIKTWMVVWFKCLFKINLNMNIISGMLSFLPDLTHGDTLIGAIHGPDRVPTHTEGDPEADLIRPSIDRGEGAVVIHQCLAEGAMQEVE